MLVRFRPGAPTTNFNAFQPVPQGAGFGVFAGSYGAPERPIVPQCSYNLWGHFGGTDFRAWWQADIDDWMRERLAACPLRS